MSKHGLIFDVTLTDGERSPQCSVVLAEKPRSACRLKNLNSYQAIISPSKSRAARSSVATRLLYKSELAKSLVIVIIISIILLSGSG